MPTTTPIGFETFFSRVTGLQQTGPTTWKACCPAHDDQHASLSISVRGDTLAVFCHANHGCTADTITKSVGLTLKDLFMSTEERPRIVATYNYRDEQGFDLFQVVRLDPKDFRQRRKAKPDDDPAKVKGDWAWSLEGVRRVVYRLPELLAAPLSRGVFIVEGEKDADQLAAIGVTATTNPGGAGKWRAEYAEWFRDRAVFVLPDNDPPGREHAAAVAAALTPVAKSVEVIELPGLPDKGDVSDWLSAGGTLDKLREMVRNKNQQPPGEPSATVSPAPPEGRPANGRLVAKAEIGALVIELAVALVREMKASGEL